MTREKERICPNATSTWTSMPGKLSSLDFSNRWRNEDANAVAKQNLETTSGNLGRQHPATTRGDLKLATSSSGSSRFWDGKPCCFARRRSCKRCSETETRHCSVALRWQVRFFSERCKRPTTFHRAVALKFGRGRRQGGMSKGLRQKSLCGPIH